MLITKTTTDITIMNTDKFNSEPITKRDIPILCINSDSTYPSTVPNPCLS